MGVATEERRDSRKASALRKSQIGNALTKRGPCTKKLFQGLCWFSSIVGSHDRQENV